MQRLLQSLPLAIGFPPYDVSLPIGLYIVYGAIILTTIL